MDLPCWYCKRLSVTEGWGLWPTSIWIWMWKLQMAMLEDSMMAVCLFSLSERDRETRNRSSCLSIVTRYKMNSSNHWKQYHIYKYIVKMVQNFSMSTIGGLDGCVAHGTSQYSESNSEYMVQHCLKTKFECMNFNTAFQNGCWLGFRNNIMCSE